MRVASPIARDAKVGADIIKFLLSCNLLLRGVARKKVSDLGFPPSTALENRFLKHSRCWRPLQPFSLKACMWAAAQVFADALALVALRQNVLYACQTENQACHGCSCWGLAFSRSPRAQAEFYQTLFSTRFDHSSTILNLSSHAYPHRSRWSLTRPSSTFMLGARHVGNTFRNFPARRARGRQRFGSCDHCWATP